MDQEQLKNFKQTARLFDEDFTQLCKDHNIDFAFAVFAKGSLLTMSETLIPENAPQEENYFFARQLSRVTREACQEFSGNSILVLKKK